MTDLPNLASITDHVRPINAGASVVGVHFIGATPVFVLGEEALLVADKDNERRVPAHGGAILASVSDGHRIVTGGDDGKVMATTLQGAEQIAEDPQKRWIDQLALASDGSVAYSAGKTAFVRPRKGEQRVWEAPSTVGGLAFAPKGFRLAVA